MREWVGGSEGGREEGREGEREQHVILLRHGTSVRIAGVRE